MSRSFSPPANVTASALATRSALGRQVRRGNDQHLRRARLDLDHTENPAAYHLYLKGRYHLNRLTDDGFLKGRDYFQQAIDLDPNYAAAYAGLADAYQMLSGYNALAPNDGFPLAKAAAMEALKLDEGLAEAHTTLGVVKLLHDWDWRGAEKEYRRASEINQSYSDAHLMYGFYLAAMERFDEAHAEMSRAQDLDPLSLAKMVGIGEILYQQRRYDQAIEQFLKALEMDPNSGLAHWALGNVYVQKGMYEEAISEYKKAIPLSGDSPDELASLGYAYALSGRTLSSMSLRSAPGGAISRRPSSLSSTQGCVRRMRLSRGSKRRTTGEILSLSSLRSIRPSISCARTRGSPTLMRRVGKT